jgi:dTDP-4-amino-4,6-dideoxygalactose transaminase
MKVPFVDLVANYKKHKTEIDAAMEDVLLNASFINGPAVKALETNFSSIVGTDYCIACANGTDALEILLEAYGVGPGDEVIVPAISWISTAEAVVTVGAKPLFVDIKPDTFLIDELQIEAKITDSTKAILPVHLYGQVCEMDTIMNLAKENDLIVIEDCAQAHNAEYKGKKVGSIGHAGSFSFYPGKNIGAYGDAGCMVTDQKDIAERCKQTTNHGQTKKHNHLFSGRNSRLDTLHAAVINVKLKYINEFTEKRQWIAEQYDRLFENVNAVRRPFKLTNEGHVYHLYVIQVSDRDKVMADLKNANIGTAVHYPNPLPLLTPFESELNITANFPNARYISDNILSLPIFPEMTIEQIEYVAAEVIKSVNA